MTTKSTLCIIRVYLTIAYEMSDVVKLESIKTEKGQIDTQNANLPQAETYAEFWNILTNQKWEKIYTKVDNIGEITIIPDISNNPNTPESNKYAIQKEQKTNLWTSQVQLCYVVGKSNIEQFLSKYISQDIKHYKETVQIQINETAEKTETIVGSQQELWTLADEITNYEYTPEGVKTYFKNANLLHKDIQKDYDATLKLIRDRQKNKNKPTILEKNMLILLEHKYTKDTRNIEQLEKTINNLWKEYKKETNVDTRKDNAKKTHLQLLYYRSQGQKLSSILHNESAQKNFVDNPDTYMDIPVESSQDALLLKNIYDAMSKERFRINELLTDANFKNIKDKNGQTMQEYLNKTLEDWATAKEEFIPSDEYKKEYEEVIKNYPQLQEWMKKDPTDKFDEFWGWSFGWWGAWWERQSNGQRLDTDPRYRTQPWRWGLFDKLTPSQLTDAIDNANIEPQTKNNLKNIAGLTFLIWAWVLAWKTISKTFKAVKWDKMEWTDRARIAAWATLFGWAYVSSGNIFNFKSLWKDLGNLFSSDPNALPGGKVDAAPEAKTANGINNVNLLFAGMKYGQIKNFVKKDSNGKMQIDYDMLSIAIDNGNLDDKITRKQALENIKTSEHPKLFDMAMTTMGITREKLNDPQQAETAYNKNATEALLKFGTITEFMRNNQYDHRNPELTTLIQSYIRTGNPDLKTLERLWAFEKDTPPEANPTLKTKIDSFTSIDTTAKNNLYYYATRVQEELENKNQFGGTFDIIEKNGKLYIQTYGEETEIEYKLKAISNEKWSKIILASNYEMIKAANLTNRLKSLFKNQSTTDTPFNISLTGDLEFQKDWVTTSGGRKNPREKIKNSFDTEAVDGWRRSTLQEISPNLEKYKDSYVTFLNNMKIRKK